MIYNILATGSTGNAVLINGTVLIDCGVPQKTLRPYARQIMLVLLTHEHGDHFNRSTVRWLAHARPALRWGCCDWMVPHLLDAGVPERQIDVYEPDLPMVYMELGLGLIPVFLHHNVPNCGYKITAGGQSLFYATDTGTLDGIEAKDFDLYMVEANHTVAEIEARAAEKAAAGEFAYELRAAQNHLSVEQATDWLAQNMSRRSLWIPMHGHKEGGDQNG